MIDCDNRVTEIEVGDIIAFKLSTESLLAFRPTKNGRRKPLRWKNGRVELKVGMHNLRSSIDLLESVIKRNLNPIEKCGYYQSWRIVDFPTGMIWHSE